MMTFFSNLIELNKSIQDKVKIPILNIIFIISIYFWHKSEHYDSNELFNFIPEAWVDLVFSIFYDLFSIFFTVLLISIVLFLLVEILPTKKIFQKFLPKDKEFSDGTRESWNTLTGVEGMLKILIEFGTNVFIIYFSSSVLFNNFPTTYDIFEFMGSSQAYEDTFYLLLIINTLLTIFYILKSLFCLKGVPYQYQISSDQFEICKLISKKTLEEQQYTLYFCKHYRKSKDYILLLKRDDEFTANFEIVYSTLIFEEAKYKFEHFVFESRNEGWSYL